MTRIYILTMADGRRHAFDDRQLIVETISNNCGQPGDTFSTRDEGNARFYYVAGICVARDTACLLHDTSIKP